MAALGLTDSALSANKDHQKDILDFAAECQARLKAVESLLGEVGKLEAVKQRWKDEDGVEDISDEDFEEKGEEIVFVKGALPAVGPSKWVNLKADDSPFHSSFALAEEHRVLTTPRPWSSKERAALRISLQTELRRALMLDVQSRGGSALEALKTFDGEAALRAMRGDQVRWDNVARIQRNNSMAKPERTGAECRIQWLGVDDMAINNAEWEESERDSLVDAVKKKLAEKEERGRDDKQSGLDWDGIVTAHNEKFQTRRTVIQCVRTYRASVVYRPREFWTNEEDDRLEDGVTRFGTTSWVKVAKYIGHGRTARGARNRWQQLDDDSTRKGAWTAVEDGALVQAVRNEAQDASVDWKRVAESVPGRSRTQCRMRWHFMTPADREKADANWADEEDGRLVDAKENLRLGFAEMMHLFPGRTEKSLEERYTQLGPARQAAYEQWVADGGIPGYTPPRPIHSSRIREELEGQASASAASVEPVEESVEEAVDEPVDELVDELVEEAVDQPMDEPVDGRVQGKLKSTPTVETEPAPSSSPGPDTAAALKEAETEKQEDVVSTEEERPVKVEVVDNIAARVRGRRRGTTQQSNELSVPAASPTPTHKRKAERESVEMQTAPARRKRGRSRK
ncbi:hypothetical protein CALCODRAFT_482072 [Calocera cornea HHB12733]|uniref:Myb-like domain-containing protein n=1 Tax=Calocera cornea HHB12733 TaxID=1353952 RepID=A0A165H2J3_9BASI|nr:hypothetical protein CALCODRAFT_482072 [Calocera cornea HHB12733]